MLEVKKITSAKINENLIPTNQVSIIIFMPRGLRINYHLKYAIFKKFDAYNIFIIFFLILIDLYIF
jgi:hypothetical protein